jgi:hypothetical protein
VVVDALSRKYEEDMSLFSLSFLVADWLNEFHQESFQDPKISHMIQQLQKDPHASLGYSWHNEELLYKGHMYLRKQSHFKPTVLSELHASPTTGHLGFNKTYERIIHSFFGEGMKHDIHTFVIECDTCQFNKGETIKILETCKYLPIPPAIWTNISMEFIVILPKFGNKSVIMVVVSRLYKYVTLCALQHPFTTSTVAQIFIENIFKLHGTPDSIVSERDPTFTSHFWKDFFKL